jgi:hypothetical protein
VSCRSVPLARPACHVHDDEPIFDRTVRWSGGGEEFAAWNSAFSLNGLREHLRTSGFN